MFSEAKHERIVRRELHCLVVDGQHSVFRREFYGKAPYERSRAFEQGLHLGAQARVERALRVFERGLEFARSGAVVAQLERSHAERA